jgi:hypothetical protein
VGKKLADPKTVEKLALLAVAKAGPGESIADVTRQVIADYFGAKEAFRQYNDSVLSPKAALKLLGDKRQENKAKTKTKTKTKAKKTTKAAGE